MVRRRTFLASIAVGAVPGGIVDERAGRVTLGAPGASPTAAQADEPVQTAKLLPVDGDSGDLFGHAVSLSAAGTTVVVGARIDEDPNGNAAGSAYVFERAGDAWDQTEKLAAEDGDADDLFGHSVTVSADGTTAVVGAQGDEDPNGADFAGGGGSAYVFERAGDEWVQTEKLAAEDGDGGDLFGHEVAISADGTVVAVGARIDEDPNGDAGGSAYVFERVGDTWVQRSKLAARDGDSNDEFGEDVAVSADGTTVLVGAEDDDDPGGGFSGSTYVFKREGDAWVQTEKLVAEDADGQDLFGHAVALSADGTTAAIGAPGDEDPNGSDGGFQGAGSAYVFERTDGTWRQRAKLAAADGDGGDRFGHAVSLSAAGTTVVVGARLDEDPNGNAAGSAYVFERGGGAWSQRSKITAEDGDDGDQFGHAIAVSGDASTVVAGAEEDEDPNGADGAGGAGSAYAFDLGEGDGLARFDRDGDGRIGTRDVLRAVAAFNGDELLGGRPVDRADVLEVIEAYGTATPV